MSPRARARLVSLAALLPLLVVAVSGLGYDRLRCTFTGEVSPSSDGGCCPVEDAPATPVANAASCCDHESGRTVKLPAVATESHALAAAPAPATPFAQLPPPAPAARPRAPRATSHAPPFPPLLLKQSFLI